MDFESMRMNYLRMSYAKASQEGKLPQWFLKQGLFWLLRAIAMLLIVAPIKLIWRYTERGCEDNGLVHIVKFCVGVLIYVCILGAIVCAPFMNNSSAAVTQ